MIDLIEVNEDIRGSTIYYNTIIQDGFVPGSSYKYLLSVFGNADNGWKVSLVRKEKIGPGPEIFLLLEHTVYNRPDEAFVANYDKALDVIEDYSDGYSREMLDNKDLKSTLRTSIRKIYNK